MWDNSLIEHMCDWQQMLGTKPVIPFNPFTKNLTYNIIEKIQHKVTKCIGFNF